MECKTLFANGAVGGSLMVPTINPEKNQDSHHLYDEIKMSG